MISVICDACKKPIPNAERERNYFTLLDKNLCTNCNEKLYERVHNEMSKKPRFVFKEYKKILAQTVSKMCS